MGTAPERGRSDVEIIPFGSGLMVRVPSAWPVFARIVPSDEGWSVALVAIRFDSHPQPVAAALPSREIAIEASAVALSAVEAMQEQDAYRYRFAPTGPN